MKKKVKVLVLMICLLAVGGCNVNRAVTEVSQLAYKEVKTNEDLAYNLNLVSNQIRSTKFMATLIVEDKKYDFSGEIIAKNTIANSIIHINYKNNNLYLKNGIVYLSYYYKNTNVIVKDNLDNFVNEAIALLQSRGIKCNKNKIDDIIKNKSLSDIDFTKISNKLENINEGYKLDYKGTSTIFSKDYLPVNFIVNKKNISLNMSLNYGTVSIKIPFGYNLLTLSIQDIKDLLEIDNISYLIK